MVGVAVVDELLVVELEVHAVVYFVVLESDVILEDGVPLLQHDLVPPGSGLSCNQFLEISDGVVFVALDAHLLTQTTVHGDLNHSVCVSL